MPGRPRYTQMRDGRLGNQPHKIVQKDRRSLGYGLSQRRRPSKRKTDNDLKVFTWNVRTLYRARAAQQLADVLSKYKADITALQELRWTEEGVLEKGSYDIYYSCHPRHHVLGTGFLVSRRIKPAVIGFASISERLCTLRVRGMFQNITLINVHAPTEESSDQEKDAFYDQVERTLSACSRYDVKIVLGDMNGKVGREPIHRQYAGSHSLHEISNDNGLRITHLAAAHNLIVGSTWFPRRDVHKATWTSPDGITSNQIDHVLIDRRHRTSLMNVRTYRGANIDSDHYLVGAVFRARISTPKEVLPAGMSQINTDGLKIEQLRNKYAEELDDALVNFASSPGDRMPINDMWQHIKTHVVGKATTILGHSRKKDRNDWFDDECKLATEHKNEAYRAMLSSQKTRARVESYRELRKQEKKLHRRKKKAWEEQLVSVVEEYRAQPHQARKFYQQVRGMKPYTPRTSYCKDKQGNLVSDQNGILERWVEYFDELLNGQLNDELEVPTTQGVDAILESARSRRNCSRAVPTWRRPTTPSCSSTSAPCMGRRAPFAQTIIGSYQCGFTPGKSTTDQIFSLRLSMEKMREHDQALHHLFIDFKAAYDSIVRVKLYEAMGEFGIPNKLIKLTRMTMTDVRSKVKANGSLSREFCVNNGLRQGDGLSCVLFNLALDKAIRDSGVSMRGVILNKSTQLLAYADDIDIMGRNPRAVQEAFIQIEHAARNLGLQINEGKTKYMVASSAATPATSTESIGQTGLPMGDYNFEVTNRDVMLDLEKGCRGAVTLSEARL
ncbi:uncharacterized protein LOC129808671 [Phlebotomus papatasi]|uniref:uncharacterized protein LOC129808671 n=1 Tax=Phlebotomus papatasi TaxID=29031 RepID=UPI002484096F|nr:uncharacterized protein LOC129808671 [Phlebotomus papatasi]